VEHEVRDVTALALEERFDLITAFDAIHDQAHPAQVLAGIARALRPGGTFLMVDIRASSNLEDNLEHPLATMLYTTSTMHCMTVSLAQGGAGLGTVWGEQLARQMLAEAGFGSVEVKSVEGDIFNSYFVATKGM
jgi:2-polyprenyl-3-methyl-5-hydroxy-6-metoxy-1,4-benzoquinol methylase